jgi:dTDP-4-dehydrorhamnose reductase
MAAEAVTLLVIGRSGQLATALRERVAGVACLGRSDIDLMSIDAVRAAIKTHAPRAVVNAAAYTAVDRAETERDLALGLNATAPEIMARACAEAGVPFVHVSSDYVFNGERGAPYAEDHPTDPVNFYGETKVRGEEAVLEQGGRTAVVRTSWVFSDTGTNFVKTMIRLAGEREEISVVADQRGRPTSAWSLADACTAIADAMSTHEDAAGIYHFANGGEAVWFELAQSVMDELTARGHRAARIRPISTAEYPTPAKRPADSRLATGRIEALLAREIPHWHAALAEVCDRLMPPPPKGA